MTHAEPRPEEVEICRVAVGQSTAAMELYFGVAEDREDAKKILGQVGWPGSGARERCAATACACGPPTPPHTRAVAPHPQFLSEDYEYEHTGYKCGKEEYLEYLAGPGFGSIKS